MPHMSPEEQKCVELESWLAPAFETWREVRLRHALFRRCKLRIDLLAVPREEPYRRIALGFEVKGHAKWDEPIWAKALKQASDYVLATVEPDRPDVRPHVGKRVMAVFVWPAPSWVVSSKSTDIQGVFLSGMAQMAGYLRVGRAMVSQSRRPSLELTFGPNDVWGSVSGWRPHAHNMLVGKRQIGSQRFNILDELEAMEKAS